MVLYRLFTGLILVALRARIALARLARRPAPAGLAERLDRPVPPAGTGPLIWLHGASNGELTSARPLIAALLDRVPDLRLLITANSLGGRDLVRGWALARTAVTLAPFDQAGTVARFLDTARPVALVMIENEIWPNRLELCAARGIPVLVAGARLSSASARAWGRFPRLARRLVAAIRWAAPQDEGSRARLIALGLSADRLGPVLTLKSAAARAGGDGAPAGPARAQTLLAASTHAGEDEVVLDAVVAARATLPDLHLILAPRHPRRRDRIEALIRARGLGFATRSRGAEPAEGLPVYLADTLGEMERWYGMAGMTFVGGSLVEKGGHTPFEPAAHGSAILHGPHRANFAPAYGALAAGQGAVEVRDADSLAAAILALADPAAQAALAGRAGAALAPFGDKAATEAVLAALAAATGIAEIGQEPQTTGEPDAIHA